MSQPKEVEKKKEEIDPLNFFSVENHIVTGNKELNELLDIIEVVNNKEENNKEENNKNDNKTNENKKKEDSWSSSDSDNDSITEEQRLMNKKLAVQNLFKKKENCFPEKNEFTSKKNKISENLTKEEIMEKFKNDFDGDVELPELNEQKKQIMLKKMKKAINKFSSLNIKKHMNSELREIIEDKIEHLKKLKGNNYSKIEDTIQELILSLKQPNSFFSNDENIQQIIDEQEPYDIKPKTNIDFAFFMKQEPKRF